ncbi:hypothetical protein I3W98_40795, partial [Streptomyces cavourensis]|nr:hypothetical protein [Streptomyces cavourensis]
MSTPRTPYDDWRRLDPRTVLVTALVVAGVVAGAAHCTCSTQPHEEGSGHAQR